MKLKKRFNLLLLGAVASVAPLVSVAVSCANNVSDKTNGDSQNTKTSQENPSNNNQNGNANNPNGQDAERGTLSADITPAQRLSKLSSEFKSSLRTYASRGIINNDSNTTYNKAVWEFDNTYASGSFSSETDLSLANLFLEYRFEGELSTVTVEVLEDNVNVSKTYYTSPLVGSLKLSAADAMVLVVDGQEVVFDSDDAEVRPEAAESFEHEGQTYSYYKNPYVEATSNNERSINSQNFKDQLAKSSEVRFRIRPEQVWVDKNGQKTEYKVTAEDYYLGYMKTQFLTTTYRRQQGGSQELDEALKQTLEESNTSLFDEKTQNKNNYLLPLFNIDQPKLMDREQTVLKKDNQEYYVVKRVQGATSWKFYDFLDSFYNKADFLPLPSQYIEANKDNPVYDFQQKNALSAEEQKQLKAKLSQATGLAKDMGYYWYGFTPETTLFSGKYYTAGYNAENTSVEVLLNKHHHDRKFVDAPTTVQKVITQYKTTPVDGNVFLDQLLHSYTQGSNPYMSLSPFSKDKQDTISSNKPLYGENKVPIINKNSYNRNATFELIPNISVLGEPGQEEDKYKPYVNKSMNDAFVALQYGLNVTLEQLINGTAKIDIEHATVGMGGEFKSILYGAINWYNVAQAGSNPRVSTPYYVAVAPDNKIKGSEAESAENTVRGFVNEVNKLFVIDSANASKYTLTSRDNKKAQEISVRDYLADRLKTNEEKYKSIYYQDLQEKMTALLDKFYEAKPNLAGQKVKLQVGNYYLGVPQLYHDALSTVLNVLEGLDKKGRLEFSLMDKEARIEELIAYWYSVSPARRGRWNYDYDGIGTGFDGYSTYYFMPIFGQALANAEYRTKLQSVYPAVAKALDKLEEFMKTDTNFSNLSIPLDKWNLLTNAQLKAIENTLHRFYYDKETQQLKEIAENNTTEYADLGVATAKFWIYVEQEFSKQELLDLTKELGNLLGMPLFSDGYSSVQGFSHVAVNPYYRIPVWNGKLTAHYNKSIVLEENSSK
nr:oligopeptide ABC transporter substrate-binding protein [Mycoplasma sp. Ms02]